MEDTKSIRKSNIQPHIQDNTLCLLSTNMITKRIKEDKYQWGWLRFCCSCVMRNRAYSCFFELRVRWSVTNICHGTTGQVKYTGVELEGNWEE